MGPGVTSAHLFMGGFWVSRQVSGAGAIWKFSYKMIQKQQQNVKKQTSGSKGLCFALLG